MGATTRKKNGNGQGNGASATTPIYRVTTTSVRDLPEWATDEMKVDGFRSLIRRGRPLPPLRLHAEAGGTHTVIDGFHRYRALLAEGVGEFLAQVEECDARTAEVERIAACIGQPDPVLIARAIEALRMLFVRDLAEPLTGHTLYVLQATGKGAWEVVPRSKPLPGDPLLAVLALYDHAMAERIREGREAWSGDVWAWLWEPLELAIGNWLTDMAAMFGEKREWIEREVLRLGLLPGTESDAEARNWWSHLVQLGNDDLQALVAPRLRTERPQGWIVGAALRWACGPRTADEAQRYPYIPARTHRDVVRLLAANTFTQLYQAEEQAHEQYQERERQARAREHQADGEAGQEKWGAVIKLQQSGMPIASATEAVFGTVGRGLAERIMGTYVGSIPAAARPAFEIEAKAKRVIKAVDALMREGAAYEKLGGNYAHPEVAASLSTLASWLRERVALAHADEDVSDEDVSDEDVSDEDVSDEDVSDEADEEEEE